MVMAILAALTLAVPDTGRVPIANVPPGGAPVAFAADPVVSGDPAVPAQAGGPAASSGTPTSPPAAEPRFQLWRPPAMQASPASLPLPLTLDMPGAVVGRRSPVAGRSTVVGQTAADSQQARPPLVDYSDFYYTRLTIHKWASWAMLPLFGLEYYTGTQVYKQGLAAPRWERRIHGPVAATLAGLFAVNTVTGVWNLWDGRKDPDGRAWRTAHGLLMLLADAGFVATGLTAPHYETESGVYGPGSGLTGGYGRGNQRLHKQIAISSMAVAMVSWVMMLPPFRRD